MQEKIDEGLKGNEKIEEYIEMLQKQPSEEVLAATLTAIRRRMKEGGEVIVSVEPSAGNGLNLRILQLENGDKWLVAFTGFEEEMRGKEQVMSTFLAKMEKLFDLVLQNDEVQGMILNPFHRTLMMSKDLIRIVKG